MSLTQLPPNWLEWLTLNIERGCAQSDLLRDMENGGIARMLAIDALREITEDSIPTLVPLPQLDLCDQSVRFEMNDPRVVLIDRFLQANECDALVRLAQLALQESVVVDQDTGESVQHPARTGSLAFMKPGSGLIDSIEARIASLLQWPLASIEHLQVIGYAPSEEYRAHHDCFDESSDGAEVHLNRGGQRVGTLLMYLKAPESGGATRFPQLGDLQVQPQCGSALWFQNVRTDGKPDPRLLHAGDPVTQGVKWVCTAWVRESAWRHGTTVGDMR